MQQSFLPNSRQATGRLHSLFGPAWLLVPRGTGTLREAAKAQAKAPTLSMSMMLLSHHAVKSVKSSFLLRATATATLVQGSASYTGLQKRSVRHQEEM